MQLVIDIPEEFGIEIENRFQDFFKRLETETKNHMISGSNLVCGAYELETIDMFLKAFNSGTPLSKTIDGLKELSKDHRHNYVGNSCEERAWRLGIEDSIDVILAESEGKE